MNPLDEFTEFEYFHLIKLPFMGVTLVSIGEESVQTMFCQECGLRGIWETIRKSSHLPMFDADSGDRFRYDVLVCPRKKFAWSAWRTCFKTPCRLFLIFRRCSLKRSV